MKTLKTYHYLIYPILYVFFFGLISLFALENTLVNYGLPGFLAILCSPKYNTIKTQSGEKTIISWMLFRKSFNEKI
jgi:hypothetical protein